MIDLHMHSTVSDGSLTPEALAQHCAEAGLSAVALTDHDTMGGCRRFLRACATHGVEGVAAVELSAEYSPGTMHVLGYVPSEAIEGLQAELAQIQDSRALRNARILEALEALGVPVTTDEVQSFAGEGVTGRPHIALAMEQRGYVRSREEAFSRYLGKGCPAYRDRYRLSPPDCVGLINRYGGAAVLAHPFTLRLSHSKMSTLLDGLTEAGLSGVEVLYPEHNEQRRSVYQALARERGLIETGGSDFHGRLNPAIQIGRGFGNVSVPDSVLAALKGCMRGQTVEGMGGGEDAA